ncbi:transposase [Paraburkholderia ribeironis]|uniref:Transposase n=1 Tax=Paraburkholderia ribeironis TaxID=1247936 RepID=A0A1N7SKJ4_9BURK|nr:transposase [Paraburkholderia ribeironis]
MCRNGWRSMASCSCCTGIRWNHLPTTLEFGSGATCWRRLDAWQKVGVWTRLRALLLDKLRESGELALPYAAIDSSSVRAVGAGKNWAEPYGSRAPIEHHVLVDANGLPVSVNLGSENCNDVTQLLPLVDAIAPIRGARGRPMRKPKFIYGDRGYDSDAHRQRLRDRGIRPVIAWRRTEQGGGLGKFRWVVDRTHSWLHNFRRLCIRFDRRSDIHEAFLKLACSLVCWNTFKRAESAY